MPCVVENQLEVFRSDPVLSHLAQGTNIRYGACLHAPEQERREKFLQGFRSKRLAITFPSHGVNMEINLCPEVREHNNDMIFESQFIFNGVCCRLKGRINKNSLVGTAKLEFDAETAEREAKLAAKARPYLQRITNLRNLITGTQPH
ncbi:unnamed protein product [Bursaphelenchus xylophilus]|uniref:(pine wood nematode) hypothetical protein n=1 Tax=Bursaphelenchus xylophilus TaxID=6326 RepID=A0A1I7RVE1_BURXY|nr:unnamed protein product [Bursaphelenchus xylophilus]CAG9086725.1 unnamed protein product [Bursaphelenchus xylophilus]